MSLKKGDQVVIIAGKDKNKEGVIESVLPNGKVIIEGANIAKKHAKPSAMNSEGGIIDKEMPIDVSNVMLLDPSTKKGTRVRFEVKDGKKVRISKASGKEIIRRKEGKRAGS